MKRKRNPSSPSYEEAIEVTKGFHGREPQSEGEYVEIIHFDKNLGELFTLLEINILHPDSDDEGEVSLIPISFKGCDIRAATNKDRRQIYFVGGDQSLDLEDLEKELGVDLDSGVTGRQYINIGEVYSIAYHTDKWHLEGPKSQKDGTDYEHTFAEEDGGSYPELMYDKRNKKIVLMGGSYEVRDEGIWN